MTEADNVQPTLNPQQEAFCQFYTGIKATFGNGTRSYAEAYGYDIEAQSREDEVRDPETKKLLQESSYKRMCDVCANGAYALLRKPEIDKRIKTLLATMPNETIDARLNEIIAGGKPQDSIAAIKELNKLRQRITEKLDVTSGGKTIAGFNFIRNSNGNTPDDTTDA